LSVKSAHYNDCDIEDWSNDDENSALITEINDMQNMLKLKAVILNCNNISRISVFTVFPVK